MRKRATGKPMLDRPIVVIPLAGRRRETDAPDTAPTVDPDRARLANETLEGEFEAMERRR